jgi:hypothetical protein
MTATSTINDGSNKFLRVVIAPLYFTAVGVACVTHVMYQTTEIVQRRVRQISRRVEDRYVRYRERLEKKVRQSYDRGAFEKFPELPREIRLLVWRSTFPDPRIVELQEGHNPTGYFMGRYTKRSWVSPVSPPNTLWINHESRTETLRHYRLAFSRDGYPSRIWFDFDRDTVYFHQLPSRAWSLGPRDEFREVRRIAVQAVHAPLLVRYLRGKLGSCAELTLVLGCSQHNTPNYKTPLEVIAENDRLKILEDKQVGKQVYAEAMRRVGTEGVSNVLGLDAGEFRTGKVPEVKFAKRWSLS